MFVNPISIAPPASTNTERRVVIHEPSPTKASQKDSKDILAVDFTAAEDIGQHDNVTQDGDAVLPQLQPEPDVVSSLVPTNSEHVSISYSPTLVLQDEFWDEMHPDSPVHEVISRTPPTQVTTHVLESPESPLESMEIDAKSPHMSPSFRRLRKGLRPSSSSSMTSIPKDAA
jgi:hypothetical protein